MASAKSRKRSSQRSSNSAINQPVAQDFSSLVALSSFSPDGKSFAFLSLAIDKHRLRVYETLSGHSRAEYVVDSGRVTSLAWTRLDLSGGPSVPSDDETNRPKKKRKKRQSLHAGPEDDALTSTEIVVLGLSDGSLSLFSPSHGRVLRTLSHPTSNTSILSVVVSRTASLDTYLWTSGADGAVRIWNATKNSMVGSLKVDNRIPYSSMAFRPVDLDEEDGNLNLLLANHAIRLLSTEASLTHLETQKTEALATFTGHASPVTRLHWDVSQQPAVRFVSMAQADRFMYIWQLPNPEDTNPTEGKIIASIPLDSDARTFSLCNFTGVGSKQHILTLSASGKIALFPVPSELSTNSRKSHQKVPTLLPRSTISITPKKHSSNFQVVDVAFTSKEGQILVAKIVGGVRPFFEVVDYLDFGGNFIQDVNISHADSALDVDGQMPMDALNQRYVELNSVVSRIGVGSGHEDELARDIEGNLEVDLAELSLGQRLTALSGADENPSDGTSDDQGQSLRGQQKPIREAGPNLVPANSLTRTLIQALHSSDTRLLETCLAHSEPTIIRNTVRKLPPQLVVPLLTACVERLGQGARSATMKGGGGGASSQRGMALVAWIKVVLAVHHGHLITIPDLVARLSRLHATLTARLALQESLLLLSGRLDMVLSQIESRGPATSTASTQNRMDIDQRQKKTPRYVEGESELDDDEQIDLAPGPENDDEVGSIEDIELGGGSEEEGVEMSDEESEDEDEDEGEDSESGGYRPNGFIDDEAEEFDDEEEDDGSE